MIFNVFDDCTVKILLVCEHFEGNMALGYQHLLVKPWAGDLLPWLVPNTDQSDSVVLL